LYPPFLLKIIFENIAAMNCVPSEMPTSLIFLCYLCLLPLLSDWSWIWTTYWKWQKLNSTIVNIRFCTINAKKHLKTSSASLSVMLTKQKSYTVWFLCHVTSTVPWADVMLHLCCTELARLWCRIQCTGKTISKQTGWIKSILE